MRRKKRATPVLCMCCVYLCAFALVGEDQLPGYQYNHMIFWWKKQTFRVECPGADIWGMSGSVFPIHTLFGKFAYSTTPISNKIRL